MSVEQQGAAPSLSRRNDLATVAEFAGLVRQHEKTIYARVTRGQQPGVIRVGRCIRIDLAVALAVESSGTEKDGHTRS